MGQKVHPHGFRLGISKTWVSNWYASKNYVDHLLEDHKIRKMIKKKLYSAGVSKVYIERAADKTMVTIYTARPGMVIGKKGSEIENLKNALQKMTKTELFLDIQEIRKAELDAQLVAENIALQLEKRVGFRRVMKKTVQSTMKSGAKGVKVMIAGRLNGADMARREWYLEGRVPLHTLRANIDYATANAKTTYGIIGVKVWVYKGDVFSKSSEEKAA